MPISDSFRVISIIKSKQHLSQLSVRIRKGSGLKIEETSLVRLKRELSITVTTNKIQILLSYLEQDAEQWWPNINCGHYRFARAERNCIRTLCKETKTETPTKGLAQTAGKM